MFSLVSPSSIDFNLSVLLPEKIKFSLFFLTKYKNHLTSFLEFKIVNPMGNLSGDYNECVSHWLLNNTSNSLFDTINVFLFLPALFQRTRSLWSNTYFRIYKKPLLKNIIFWHRHQSQSLLNQNAQLKCCFISCNIFCKYIS